MPTLTTIELSYPTGETHYFRLLSLRGRLQLEIRGMKGRYPRTAYSIIKKEFRLTGSRESVLRQFNAFIEMVKERDYGVRHPFTSTSDGNPERCVICGSKYASTFHVCGAHEQDSKGIKCICTEGRI